MINNKLKMKDLFQNPKLASIFPQFKEDEIYQNIQSEKYIQEKVKQYLENALGGQFLGGNLTISGKKEDIFQKVQVFKYTLEGFFNNLQSITRNLRRNTAVYTPFNNVQDILMMSTNEQKIMALNIILNNINYNPDFKSENSVQVYNSKLSFIQRQEIWKRKVGYKQGRNYE